MQESLSRINEFFRSRHSCHPIDINSGHCYHWAMIAYTLYGGELYTTRGHAFLYKDNKFFDSECIDGVDSWEDIPTIKRRRKFGFDVDEPFSQSTEEFIQHWDAIGRYSWCQSIVNKGIKSIKENSI